MCLLQTVLSTVLLTVLLSSSVPSQACGGAFDPIDVVDANGKAVAQATIELLARIPLLATSRSAYNEDGIAVNAADVEALLKNKQPLPGDTDRCGNPFRQTFGVTRVMAFRDDPKFEGVFGYCTSETYGVSLLLKVSANGYKTAYYRGPFLGGCGKKYKFVLLSQVKG